LKAAEQALRQLRRPEDVAKARGKRISEVLPQRRVVAEEVSPVVEVEADAGA
jgi:hypothetical protein